MRHDARPDSSGSIEHALANGARLLSFDPEGAAEQAREILHVTPGSGDGLRLLAAALRRLGRDDEAQQAELDAIAASANHPVLAQVAAAINEGRLREAEQSLRPYLRQRPGDVGAIRALAEIAARMGALPDAEALLRRALAMVPRFTEARTALARVLIEQGKLAQGVEALDEVLVEDGSADRARKLRAATLARLGDYDSALSDYQSLLEADTVQPALWTSYGHVLKTVGKLDEAVSAYRRAVILQPTFGEAWWSLSNIKTFRLEQDDIAAMTAALENEDAGDTDKLHLHFALGKAYEDGGHHQQSFAHYAEANRVRRAIVPHDPELISAQTTRSIALFTRPFFAEREGQGAPASDPIFVIGMPRAGSTLIEQILASHPLVEGTSELPYIPALAAELGGGAGSVYPDSIASLDLQALQKLGEEYLAYARRHRKTGRPFFIDKMPNNWMHVGLIRLILPNARIIDARRNALDCCLSNFKQHFSQGQAFAYSLEDLGRYYADYRRMMDHYDAVLPGLIHTVRQEQLVAAPEQEIRRLLDHLGLEFDPGCLNFHENRRAVRTPSAEQVRRPINREGIGQWRAYACWLGPLQAALGPQLTEEARRAG